LIANPRAALEVGFEIPSQVLRRAEITERK